MTSRVARPRALTRSSAQGSVLVRSARRRLRLDSSRGRLAMSIAQMRRGARAPHEGARGYSAKQLARRQMLAHARSHTTRGRDVEDSALGRAVSLARGARALAADGNAASLPDDGSATLRRRAATDDFTPGHSLPLRGARSTPPHFGMTGVGATRRRRRRRRRARPPLFLGCGGGGTREAGGTKGTSHIGGTKGAALSSRYVMVIIIIKKKNWPTVF